MFFILSNNNKFNFTLHLNLYLCVGALQGCDIKYICGKNLHKSQLTNYYWLHPAESNFSFLSNDQIENQIVVFFVSSFLHHSLFQMWESLDRAFISSVRHTPHAQLYIFYRNTTILSQLTIWIVKKCIVILKFSLG